MGSTLNFYDFSWNYSTALTDLSMLNPVAAQQVQLNKNAPMLAACYNEPLPVTALGIVVVSVGIQHHSHVCMQAATRRWVDRRRNLMQTVG